MARNNKKRDLLPEPKHRLVEAKSRSEMLRTYENMEIKRDWVSQEAVRRVEDPLSCFYGGLDPRRRNFVADGGMVKEDNQAMANLSPRFIHRQYPAAGFGANPYMDDTVMGAPEEDY